MILNNEQLNIELESAKLKIINAEAANLLLRQHIQPHFLFNALSTLKSLNNSDPESGEAYLIRKPFTSATVKKAIDKWLNLIKPQSDPRNAYNNILNFWFIFTP
jgi:LytS/YehU family sensor histidine kinase